MKPSNEPLVWQGRLHLGDEPGTYGDAAYVGLAVEFPITVHPMSGAAPTAKPLLEVVLRFEGLRTYPPYPGHRLTVVAHVPVEGSNPPSWKESPPLLDGTLPATADEYPLSLDLTGLQLPAFLSIRVRCDTTVAPGLYNDFVLNRLEAGSPAFTCYATFGFE